MFYISQLLSHLEDVIANLSNDVLQPQRRRFEILTSDSITVTERLDLKDIAISQLSPQDLYLW